MQGTSLLRDTRCRRRVTGLPRPLVCTIRRAMVRVATFSPVVYQLRGDAGVHIDPPIWRRLHVPGRFILASLHDVIQVAMGWEDNHLNGFEIDRVRYGPPRSGTPSPFAPPSATNARPGWPGSCTRSRLFSATPTTSATRGTTSSRSRTSPSPTLTPGARCAWRASGPARQNCGGVPGHYHLLDVMDDPDHGDDEHLTEWLSARFDPERVDCDAVNRRLAQLSVTPSLLSAADPRDGTLRQASMWLTSAGCTQRQASM